MKQSIKLLGMATKDLVEYVETAVATNPFLKKEFGAKGAGTYAGSRTSRKTDSASEEYDYRTNIPQQEDQRLSLISQIRMMDLKGKALEAAEYLIYEMDDNGYIPVELEEVADALSVDMSEVEKALEVIQSMDPPGIGARDVQDCLQLQLKRKGKKNSIEYAIVTEFINELARNDVDKISKALNVSKEKVRDAIDNVKKLNPRPASTILAEEAPEVIPDLIAEVKDKNINLMLNRDWLPQLGFYNPYENQPEIVKDAQAKKFIKENMDSAKILIDNLRRREETIYKVASYILSFQIEGLMEGKHEVKSLTLRDVATALNMHHSTISRTVSNKYIQIDNEVMPLKSFLSKGVEKEGGEIISKANIKKKIEAMIKNEDKAHPLNDENIRKRLEAEGIRIERRTIAKYRNTLRILPAYLRKKVE